MSRLGVVLPALTLVLSGGLACAAASEAPDAAARPTTAERRIDTLGPIDTVVAISIDGLNPNAITKLRKRGTPALHRLIRTGASTLNARTELELTDTLPNHTGMVTGRRIEAATGGHGVTWNDDRRRPSTVQAAAGHEVESVFDVVHDAGGSTAYFASKTKFSLWERSWDEAIDTDVIIENNRRLTRRFVADLAGTTRSFRLLHLSAPDAAGHDHGFMSPRYLETVTATDRLVGKVLRAISSSPTLSGHTAVILTSDHGGRGASHRAPNRPANYTVPFMVWGPDVAVADLYDINPTYTDPGRTQSTYDDATIRNGDVANLALDLLELPAVTDSEHNVAQDLVTLTTDPNPAAG
ncbi:MULTISPECIES: alkaline phosphatase family protein [Nocardioides]|uniref:alkaline phosphatase family protein n=1 Tax=Nocardioides TaxID=1839 RepID=UPI00032E8E3A|nr:MULTISPECIES: alkaline phosphatase family protein [Nocardioides]EON24941.1 type I phosphodiesterase/nucleotide [Nocardioides sp. CF8]